MLGDALSYLKHSDDWIPTLLIGGVLSVLSALVLPAFVLQGYLVRVLRGAAKGDRAAPSFTDWGGLAVDGIKLFLVDVAYSIPLLVVWFAVFFITDVSSAPGTPAAPNGGPGVLTALGLLLFLLLAVVTGYFVPAAHANFAIEGSLGAAFDIPTIVSGATTGAYFKGWLLAVLVGVVGGLAGVFLSALVVGIFVLFYVQVTTNYLFGRGFAAGLGKKRRGVVESNA